jgi:hypothetical protein
MSSPANNNPTSNNRPSNGQGKSESANRNTETKDERIASFLFDAADHPQVGLWLMERARIDPNGFIRLVGPNVNDLTRIYGKATWKDDGGKGWTHAWPVQAHGLAIVVQSGDQGTMFRVRTATPADGYTKDAGVGVGLVRFLERLAGQLAS